MMMLEDLKAALEEQRKYENGNHMVQTVFKDPSKQCLNARCGLNTINLTQGKAPHEKSQETQF